MLRAIAATTVHVALMTALASVVHEAPVAAEDTTVGGEACPASGCHDASRSCEEAYAALPCRADFYRQVRRPPELSLDRFRGMLAKGGIHPDGIVLNSEFYELPIALNHSLLEQEVSALLKSGDWERAEQDNVKQGVVSQHFRLTQSPDGELGGPYEEVDGRILRSPYIRSVLSALGGVVGNVALMRLEPGGMVDAHFDTSKYWDTRVRIHIPVRTNKKVIFSCGQRGELRSLHMRKGKAYLFDNHLGHSVVNNGKSARLHLVVDMVGTRRFWALVARGRQIGSSPKKPTSKPAAVLQDDLAQVALEAWTDGKLEDNCSAVGDALVATAAQLGPSLGAAAQTVTAAWCGDGSVSRASLRADDALELQRLATAWSCHDYVEKGNFSSQDAETSSTPPWPMPASVSLAEVADAVLGPYRLKESNAELRFLTGQAV